MSTLAKKDFYVRYRRASIGMLWAVGLPLIQSLIMAVIFSRFLSRGTSVPYPVFVLSGMVPWTFFSTSVAAATTSIVDGAGLASKVYFPRAALPIVTIWSGFRGFVPAMGVLLVVLPLVGGRFGVHLLLLVPATLLLLALCTAFSLVLSGLHVYFRDVRYVVQALIQPWFFVSGVLVPLETLGKLGKYLKINPAVGMIQLYRAAFYAAPPWGTTILFSIAWTIILISIAIPVYQRHDRNFVDRL